MPAVIPPDVRLRQLFGAQAARDVPRQARDVEWIARRALCERELRRPGFRAVETAGQYVIFRNGESVRVIG